MSESAVNVTRVVHFHDTIAGPARADFAAHLRDTVAALHGDRFLVAPTLPGVINGGDLIVHLQYSDPAAWMRDRDVLEAEMASTAVDRVFGVEYHSGAGGRTPGAKRGGVYRTLLLRVEPETPVDSVEHFERDLLSMPQHIPSMTAWRLSRVTACTGPSEWTHVWEQEFTDVHAVTGPYLTHPVHWAVVDRWFDPECTEVVIRDRVCHTYCELIPDRLIHTSN